jgi:hypothetical protein
MLAFLLLAIVLKYHATPQKEAVPEKVPEAVTLTNRLNELNTQDIPDIGACKRMRERDVEKREILSKLRSIK